MPDTNKLNLSPQKQFSDIVEKEADQPRTYRVTRQQMKEIWISLSEEHKSEFSSFVVGKFGSFFAEEAELSHEEVESLCGPTPKHMMEFIFPSYFFIPEGEPVLCRDYDDQKWSIGISDGNGGAYTTMGEPGGTLQWKQIIPYTKNPPK